jgi:hypothetical protein
MVAGLNKISFNAAPNGVEPCNQQCEAHEDEQVWEIRGLDVEGVTWLGKEVIE